METATGRSLADWIETRIARYDTRRYDWDALKFQADFDPKYRRAQMRYLGTGGTGVKDDSNAVPSEHFTFSTMVLPPGSEGPSHVHDDVEEVFFMLRGKIRLTLERASRPRMLRGKIRLTLERDGESFETELGERDLISVPPGVYRGLVNEGEEEALMCVMLGASRPRIPTYPPDHPLAGIKR